MNLDFKLVYRGLDSDDHEIDLYDLSVAMTGFHRSIALITNVVLTGEVITQAPSFRVGRISTKGPQAGSLTILGSLALLGTAAYKLGTAPKGTPLGHMVHSAYDYVVSSTLGFNVDYDKSLGQSVADHKEKNGVWVSESKLDSVIEKVENSIENMHRPIVYSQTADRARLLVKSSGKFQSITGGLDQESFEFIHETVEAERPVKLLGRVSSYNSNTFKGRIFLDEEKRPVPFELADGARGQRSLRKVLGSLEADVFSNTSQFVEVTAFKRESSNGQLKSLFVTEIK